MPSRQPRNSPRTRDHARMLARIVALAEAYGCTELVALEADLDAVLRVEYLTFERAVRSAHERARLARICQVAHDACAPSQQG